MNVNEIRNRILEISHDEVAPDTDLLAKAMNWLNSAYHEMVDECMPYLGRYLQKRETVQVEEGKAVLNSEAYRLVSVVDKSNKKALQETTYEAVMQVDPALENIGAPTAFWLEGDDVYIHPKQNVELEVVYMPVVANLIEGDVEGSVLLPKQFHSALVWGGLVWGSVYERGFSSGADIKLFQNKWDEAKRKVKLSLSAKPAGSVRVKPYDVA